MKPCALTKHAVHKKKRKFKKNRKWNRLFLSFLSISFISCCLIVHLKRRIKQANRDRQELYYERAAARTRLIFILSQFIFLIFFFSPLKICN